MFLYLIRHGQSESQLADYHLPDGNLTPLGRSQAEETAEFLVREGIEWIVSSPYRRALQTADALRRRIGVPHEIWCELVEHRPEPRHRFMGPAEILRQYPHVYCDGLPEDGLVHGEEPLEAVFRRAMRVLDRLTGEYAHTDRKVAMFAHWVFNSSLLGAIASHAETPYLAYEQANACVNRVHLGPEGLRIMSVNETAHLSQVTH